MKQSRRACKGWGGSCVLFRSSKRRGTRNFKSDIVAGARRRIATLARMSASGTIRNGGYPLKRIAGWRCEEETKTDRGGAFNSDCRDPACRLYAVERDSRSGTIFGRAYADYIPFPAFDACAGAGRTGIHTGRVLPVEYLYFTGDGQNNHFTIGWKDAETWDWCLQNPYND